MTSKPELTEEERVDNFITEVAKATISVLQAGETEIGKQFSNVSFTGKLDDGRVFKMALGDS